MAIESTRKHRPTINQVRELQADAAAVVRSIPPGSPAYVRAVHVDLTLRWVLGGAMPPGLTQIRRVAAEAREAAAPATEAEVFQGRAE